MTTRSSTPTTRTSSPQSENTTAQAAEQLDFPESPVKDPFEIELRYTSLAAMVGEENVENTFSRLQKVETLIGQANASSDLLRSSSFSRWEKTLSTQHEALQTALEGGDAKKFAAVLDEMLASLTRLNKFFDYEREQGLIATHAESGVRLYKKGSSLWLVTPDATAFEDYRSEQKQAELQQFVKGVTGVTIDANRAFFQSAESSGSRKLMGCRIDALQLSSSELYQVNTKLRRDADLHDQSISFTAAHLSSGQILDDASHGFGREASLPSYHFLLRNDDIRVPEESELMGAAPRVEEIRSPSDLIEAGADFLGEHAAIPVLPDATVRAGFERGIRGTGRLASRIGNRFRRAPVVPETPRLTGPAAQARITQVEQPRLGGPAEAVAERVPARQTLERPRSSGIPEAESTRRVPLERSLAESAPEQARTASSRSSAARTPRGTAIDPIVEQTNGRGTVARSESPLERRGSLRTPVETEVPEVKARARSAAAEGPTTGEGSGRIAPAETSRVVASEPLVEGAESQSGRAARTSRGSAQRPKLRAPVEGEVPEVQARNAEGRTSESVSRAASESRVAPAETVRGESAKPLAESRAGSSSRVASAESAPKRGASLRAPAETEVPKVNAPKANGTSESVAQGEGAARTAPAETTRSAAAESVVEQQGNRTRVASTESTRAGAPKLKAPAAEGKVPGVESRASSAAAETVTRATKPAGTPVAAETTASSVVEGKTVAAESTSRVASAEAAPESTRLRTPNTSRIPGVDPNRPILPRNRSLILRPMETVQPASTALTVIEQPKVSRFSWLRGKLPTGSSVLNSGRGALRDPRVQNVAYLTGLIAMHKALAGDYSPEAEHSPLPHLTQLLGGSLADDKLRALGIETEFKTKEVGAVMSWGMDVSSSMGDIGLVYGGIKGSHYALNSRAGLAALQKLRMARVAGAPNALLRVGGRALGVAYAPIAGYSYTSGGEFIHAEGEGRVIGISIGAPVEGAIAGGLVGGPFAPFTAVGGAVISTGTAVAGTFSALGDVLDDNRKNTRVNGIKRTLKRGEEGWIKGENEPNNPITADAREYIDKLAKADFMRRIVEMKRQGQLGRDFPIYGDKWKENWENIEDVLTEVRDFRAGKGYWFGAPLDDVSASERNRISEVYDYVFENREGTQHAAEKLYQRSFLVEMRDTDTSTAWDAYWSSHAADGSKVLILDEISRVGEDFAKKFASREQALAGANPHAQSTIAARTKLVEDEVNYLKARFPNLIEVLRDEESYNRIWSATVPRNRTGNAVGEPVLLASSAVQEIMGLQRSQAEVAAEMQELFASVADPKFQANVLNGLSDAHDKETLRRHFAAERDEDVLSEERLAPLLLRAYDGMRAHLGEQLLEVEVENERREETLDDVTLPRIELSEPLATEGIQGLEER